MYVAQGIVIYINHTCSELLVYVNVGVWVPELFGE